MRRLGPGRALAARHVRRLLGGEPVVELSQASAWLALALIGLAYVMLSVVRTAE
ncbi:MAG TPA: hypothetical protein VJV79_23765 [Polyangiaceae bacterium]|nr:hypothetical protein [Polyangiaceae bacterium]